uniref:Uncharacterized protein n=1 Tax=Meloidogyne enterolobii TaxID=390850 RepID=A0A6V7Y1A4_MELEN|nr:unnamed protein product [Meloidogyne enterolobii]
MKEDISSDSDYELIQFNENLKNDNEIENKNVLVKPENQINVEELKQTFQQMIDEIKIENVKQNADLKELIEQNEGEIVFLENKIKKMEESTDKKFDELTEEMEQISNFNLNKELSFVHVANKWKEIKENCCEAKCINIENPIGTCIKGNGFVNLINDENIEYIECEKKDDSCYVHNMLTSIYAENAFNKPKDCSSNYSLFYFEIKYKIKEEKNLDNYRRINIGLKNIKNNYAELSITGKTIHFNVQNKPEGDGHFNLTKVVFKNNDIIGCGLVYPPSS